jgi:hypothetical protein
MNYFIYGFREIYTLFPSMVAKMIFYCTDLYFDCVVSFLRSHFSCTIFDSTNGRVEYLVDRLGFGYAVYYSRAMNIFNDSRKHASRFTKVYFGKLS